MPPSGYDFVAGNLTGTINRGQLVNRRKRKHVGWSRRRGRTRCHNLLDYDSEYYVDSTDALSLLPFSLSLSHFPFETFSQPEGLITVTQLSMPMIFHKFYTLTLSRSSWYAFFPFTLRSSSFLFSSLVGSTRVMRGFHEFVQQSRKMYSRKEHVTFWRDSWLWRLVLVDSSNAIQGLVVGYFAQGMIGRKYLQEFEEEPIARKRCASTVAIRHRIFVPSLDFELYILESWIHDNNLDHTALGYRTSGSKFLDYRTSDYASMNSRPVQ